MNNGSQPMIGKLVDRIVAVVGAGQTPGDTVGNGRAIAMSCAREGARVIAVDRDLDSAQETVELIVSDGGRAEALRADVTVDSDCHRFVAEIVERHGRLDVLVNNVGIGTGDASATKVSEDAWDLIHEVNLKGTWLSTKHALPSMRSQESGVIINISSIAAVCATPYLAYKTSKAAVNAMTEQLAVANARFGIRVNAVMPGLIDTPMAIEGISAATGTDPDDIRDRRNKSVPLRQRMGTAWDVANAVVFLASDDASFVSGAILPVDGAQQARSG